MVNSPITALVLGSSVAVATAGGSRHPLRRNRKLHHQKEFQEDLYGNSKRSAILREKFIAKSTLVGGRKLDGYDSNENGYTNNYDDQAADYGFEPSNFALSYHRCAAVRQFDDFVSSEEYSDTVFATKNFAIFRFCPVDTCDFQVEKIEEEDSGAAYNSQYQGAANNRAYNQQGNGNDYQYQDSTNKAYQQGNGRRLDTAYGQRYTQPKDGQVYGAKGKGCNSNYGEYMIELDDYLQLMVEHQQDRTKQYCSFCDNYMYQVYQDYINQCNNNANCRLRRTLKYEEFKNSDSSPAHDHHRELVDYDLGVCTPYGDACGDDAIDYTVTEYFQCTQVANAVYIGPHCANDGFTVTLGAYGDDKCTEYLQDVDVSLYVAENLQDDALKRWYNSKHGTLDGLFEGEEQSMCIPCQQNDNEFDALLEENGDEVNYNTDMSDVCQQVYDTSAHCHRHYKSFSKKDLSKLQYQEQQLACGFIDSVVMGNYDEMGYVNLKSNWNYQNENNDPEWVRDNMSAASMMQSARVVSPLQIFFLIFSILACGTLVVWSKTLHTSLTKKEPWAPRREWSARNVFRRPEPQQQPGINPSDSGIGASRVRSDHSAYYLS